MIFIFFLPKRLKLNGLFSKSKPSFNNIFYSFADMLFPVLDIARLAVLNESICIKLATADVLCQMESCLESSPANQLMVIRLFVNMMIHARGRCMLDSHYNAIVAGLDKITKGSSNLQVRKQYIFRFSTWQQYNIHTL